MAVSAVTSTELGYLDGVTNKIQTQLNNKANTSLFSTSSSQLGGTFHSSLNYEVYTLRKSYKCVTFTFNIKPKSAIKIQNNLTQLNAGTIPSGYRPAIGVCAQLVSGGGCGIYIDIQTGGAFTIYVNGGVTGKSQIDTGDTISTTLTWITP